MKISSLKLSTDGNCEGITVGKQFKGEIDNLGSIVVLTGGNGSGKSRFLRLLYNSFQNIKNGEGSNDIYFKVVGADGVDKELTGEFADELNIINYSHFDAKLQSPEKFSPYVIHQAKNKLKQCNYEETALNSLLYLRDLAEGYSEESNQSNSYKGLKEFIEFAKEFELEFTFIEDEKKLKIFGRDIEEANLSPGQLYALRIAVACKVHDIGDNLIFLLDEPETHLHPSLLIKVINQLLIRFKGSQFWIVTHSLSLISYLTVTREDTSVLYLEKGEVKDRLRSNSELILNSLIGTDEEQFAIKQLFASPEEMACNKFCMECFIDPCVVTGGSSNDASTSMIEDDLHSGKGIKPVTIVDYGAGCGRLLECLIEDGFKNGYEYNAYNVDPKDALYCKNIIENVNINGRSYSNKEELIELNNKVDKVVMVNVLHEIHPYKWNCEFKTIANLLKDDGELIIVEREELTMGEAPQINGYLMLTGKDNRSSAAEELFGSNNVILTRHKEKPYIIRYTISKNGVVTAINANLEQVFKQLEEDAITHITKLRNEQKDVSQCKDKYKLGLRLAFWLNQLSSSIMYRKSKD